MKYYVIAGGCDCDGTPVALEDIISQPYDSEDAAIDACQDALESSDGIHYVVMDEERVLREYPLELQSITD